MKVLHIGKYFPPHAGGMETYLRDLISSLSRQGIKNSALVHRSTVSFRSTEETFQSDQSNIPVKRAAVWARFLFTPISPTFPWLLSQFIKREQPDILHLHMPNASAFWSLFLPRARKIPWIVHWHADVVGSQHSVGLRLFYKLYRPFERAILQRCTAVIATSPPYLESSQPLGQYRKKCHVVPLGLDPANLRLPQPSPSPATPGNRLRILAVGRLTYYKGFEYLLRAASQCSDVEIQLVGKGDQEKKLKSIVRELKLEKKVTFPGHVTEGRLAEYFYSCDCLCLPSIERTEAFGLVLLEAMYYGKATIISDVPGSGMGWVVDHKVTGIKVPPENATALARAIANLQQNRGNMRQLGEAGRQKFDYMFNIENSSRGVLELYKLALDSRGQPQQARR